MQTRIKNQTGFTLIELVVVMVILALLAAVAVPKFLDLQKQAEVAAVRAVVGNLRSALSLRVARAMVGGEDLAELAGSPAVTVNTLYPMDLLSNIPTPYAGTLGTALSVADNKGTWWQGSGSHDLYYNPKNSDIADDLIDGRVRYEIELVQETVDGVLTNVGLVLEKFDIESVIDTSNTDDTDYNWQY